MRCPWDCNVQSHVLGDRYNALLWLQKAFPIIADTYEQPKLVTMQSKGRKVSRISPLLVLILIIETIDALFSLDSMSRTFIHTEQVSIH